MRIEASAGRHHFLPHYCHSLKLTRQTANEARDLGFVYSLIKRGWSLEMIAKKLDPRGYRKFLREEASR